MKSILFLIFSIVFYTGCEGSKQAMDAFGVKLSPDVNISLMAVSPSNKNLFVGESVQFTASGGTAPYVFSLDSGIGSVTSDGLYTAATVAGSGVVKAIDALGEEAYATINIAVQISISPTSAVINQGDSLTLVGSGGIPPYEFSIVAGAGSIDEATGVFSSTGGDSSSSAVVEVRDSSGNTAYSAITLNESLEISPSPQTIGFNESIVYVASGGDPPYQFSLLNGAGSIHPTTGVYTGPSVAGVSIIRVTDNSGNTVDSFVTVAELPQLSSSRSNVPAGRTALFSAINGTPPYTYSVASGGGSINPSSGEFTAPSESGQSMIQVTDLNGYIDQLSIETFIPRKVSAGNYMSCVLDFSDLTTSFAKCWGHQYYAAGSTASYMLLDTADEMGDQLPKVDLGSGVTALSVKIGHRHSCAITSDYKIKCWGYNNVGELGQGDRIHRGEHSNSMGDNLPFVDLGTGRSINNSLDLEDVYSAQRSSVCVILDNNGMKCWGYNAYGKLGYAHTGNVSDAANEAGDNIPEVDFGADHPIQISIGNSHSCALLQDHTVKCWGRNSVGQLGIGNSTDQVKAPKDVPRVNLGGSVQRISCGNHHTCALMDNGEIKCWGYNNRGQLGLGDTQHRMDQSGELPEVVDLGEGRTATYIELLHESSCAILDNGGVKCWGFNNEGQLGIGHTGYMGDAAGEMGDALPYVNLGTNRTAIKLFGGEHQTCALLDNNDVKCWGDNPYASLGQGHTYDIGRSNLSMGDNLSALNLSSSASVLKAQASHHTGCAVLSDQSVKCWGVSSYGSRGGADLYVGDESNEMGSNLIATGTGSHPSFKQIKSGYSFSCGLNQDDRLSCWGSNGYQALGLGQGWQSYGYTAEHFGDNLKFINFGNNRKVIDFTVGQQGGCAVLDDYNLACWGRNRNGELGLGHTSDRSAYASHVGENFVFTDLGTVSHPVQVARGMYSTCARFANGKVKCWGHNGNGELGIGNTTQKGDGGGEMGDNLPFIDLGSNIQSTQICAGERFACSVVTHNGDAGKLKCWGRGQYGPLGVGSGANFGDQAADMGDNLPFVQLGTGRTVKKVACGRTHTCAILDNDQLKCWGSGTYGRLGLGNQGTYGDNPGEMGDYLPYVNLGSDRYVLDIALGEYHSCAVLDNNEIKCWGRNVYAQLGLGHRTDMGGLEVTAGEFLPSVEVE